MTCTCEPIDRPIQTCPTCHGQKEDFPVAFFAFTIAGAIFFWWFWAARCPDGLILLSAVFCSFLVLGGVVDLTEQMARWLRRCPDCKRERGKP